MSKNAKDSGVDFVANLPYVFCQTPKVSKKRVDEANTPPCEASGPPKTASFSFQIQHEILSASVIRRVIEEKAHSIEPTDEARAIHQAVASRHFQVWISRMHQEAGMVIKAWLNGSVDPVTLGESLGWHRSTVYRALDRFVRLSSFLFQKADMETHCNLTHHQTGGDGKAMAIDKRLEYKASSCPTCTALKGATWEGWV